MAGAQAGRAAPGVGRRLYRGLAFALLVGVAGAAISGAPALFLQTVFTQESQRCADVAEAALAQGAEPPPCADEFLAPPAWLPLSLLFGGGAVGVAGGFAYGVASPNRRPSREREPQWLPF